MCCTSDPDRMSDSSSTEVTPQESLLLSTIQSSLASDPEPSNTPRSSSSSATSSPSTLIPEMSLDTIFIAGFLDCAQEAINFLTEMEKVSYTDETLVGLRQHLHQRHQQIRTSPYSPGSRRERRNRMRKRSNSELRRSLSMDDLSTLTPTDVSMDEGYGSILVVDDNQNIAAMEDGFDSDVDENLEQSGAGESEERIPSLGEESREDDQTNGETNDEQNEGETERRELPDLAVLAQENPAIASAAQELLQLLEEELQDSEEADLSLLQSLCS